MKEQYQVKVKDITGASGLTTTLYNNGKKYFDTLEEVKKAIKNDKLVDRSVKIRDSNKNIIKTINHNYIYIIEKRQITPWEQIEIIE